MRVRLGRSEPVKTDNQVSKLLPMVLILTVSVAGAVQVHQTELIDPLWLGSSGSAVASIFDPVVLTGMPSRKIRLAKLSLGTNGGRVESPKALLMFNRP